MLKSPRIFLTKTEDETTRAEIGALERIFGGQVNDAVQRELRRLRRRKVEGEGLVEALEGVRSKYVMNEGEERPSTSREEPAIPRVVCSEALL